MAQDGIPALESTDVLERRLAIHGVAGQDLVGRNAVLSVPGGNRPTFAPILSWETVSS